jgi:group I intron endonuclease
VTSGIYKIRCNPTGKAYIGSSCRIEKRWREHELHLIAGTHVNPHLQSAWNKYGSDAFELLIVEQCSKESIRQREQQILDESDWSQLLNVSRSASGGLTLSDEQMELARQRRIDANKKMWAERKANGWQMSDEQRKLIGSSSTGKKRPQHVIDALVESRKGKPSPLKGTTHSDDVKKKRSDSLKEYHKNKASKA